ncbi:MAG: hypothetical protein HDR09_06015 [Lachnospiraceae bacterium]|nr:hypothetical protein [Lachnospiraceae bacterium]
MRRRKNVGRILAGILAVGLLVSSMPSAVYASENESGAAVFIEQEENVSEETEEESSDQTKSPENSTEDAENTGENTENLPETESPADKESPAEIESPTEAESPEEGTENPDDKEESSALDTDFVETDDVTDAKAEATENTDEENELETKLSEQTDLSARAGNTLQIGQSTTLVCTASVNPAHPQYRNLSTTYDWDSEPKGNVDLDKNGKSCTVTAYKPGEVTVSCKIYWTYEYYDTRLKQWRPGDGSEFDGWKLTVLAGDIFVTFDANGGTVSTSRMKVEYDAAYGTLPIPTKTNSTFLGWYTERTGGTKVESSTKVAKFANHTLYAHWADHHTVTFDANGGTTPTAKKTVVNTNTYGSLPYPTRYGWVFDGWYTQPSGGTEITSSTIVNLTGPQTLYAHWMAVYTVTFDANGGKTPTSQKQVVDTHKYGELPEPERAGWIFYGWYTQADGGMQIMADTTAYLSGPQTLYAHWLRSYTVTFNALGGEVEPKTKAVVYGWNYGELPVPSRERYEFKGWFTAMQGGTQITDETIVDVEKSHVLYARWGFLYTVYFDANGGSVSIKSKTVPEGGCYGELPDAERTGYTFTGWYTEQTGGKRITDDTYVISRGEQTLYAHWTKNCTISFDAAGGTGAPSDMTVLKGEAAKLPLAFPTMQGKSFLEWEDEYGNPYQPEDYITVDEDMTLTAQWGLKEISLNNTYSVTIPFAGAAAYYLLKCSKETYHTFKCMNAGTGSGTDMEMKIELYSQATDSDGTGKGILIDSASSGCLTKKLEKDAVYIVKLEPVSSSQCGTVEFAVLESCVITYYKNENYGDYEKIGIQYAVYNVDTGFYEASISADKPDRKGWWSFVGWTAEPVYDSSKPLYKPEEKIAVEEDIDLYAVWYSRILFEESIITKMEISSGESSSKVYSEKCYLYAAYQFTPDKSAYYRFINKNVESGIDLYVCYSGYNQITSQKNFTSLDLYLDKGVTYYIVIDNNTTYNTRYPGIQVQRSYEVAYDANGGEGAPSAAYKFKGESLRISEICPTRPFYTFDKWCTTSDGNGTSYAPGALYAADSNITLYAIWKEERNVGNTTVIPDNACSDSFTACISEKGGCQYFEFTPKQDGDYRFAGTDGGTISDIRMALYNSSGKNLGNGSGDGKAVGCFINASLKAGNTYYLKVCAYDNESTGTICLGLKKIYKILYEGYGEYCTDNVTDNKTEIKYHDTDMKIISASAPDSTIIYQANGGSCGISSARISYIFEGWKREDTGELLYAYDMFTENIPLTLTTQWKINVVPEELPQASRQNYTFAGWYTEPENGVQVTDFSTVAFGENLTLYAHWLPSSYTVSLDAVGGTVSPESITVSYGNAYGELPVPTREGYVFEGWYIPHSDMKVWIGNSAIVDQAEAHTLYASWIADGATHTVIFDAQGRGPDPKAYFGIAKGSTIEEPDKPIVKGWIFGGWYKEEACVNAWDFVAEVVTGDMTLYAKWTKNETDIPDEDIPTDGKIPEGLWIAGVEESYTYTGAAIKPGIRVYDGKTRLQSGKDYTLSYKNNIKVNNAAQSSKTPAITVKGKGNYAGSETVTFQIKAVDLSDSIVLTEDITVAYNKKIQKKVPVVTYNGKKLANNKDFTVSYPNGGDGAYKEVGVYDIFLTAKSGGNFSGTRTVKCTITDNTLLSKVSVKKIPAQVYTGEAIEPELTVTYKGAPLVKDTDYSVSYTDNTEIGTAKAIVTGIGKYVGTKKVSFSITGTSLKGASVSGIENKIYNGNDQEQRFNVTLKGKALTEGTDYDVSYEKNKNVGKATVTIKGKGAYTGTIKKTFTVGKFNVAANADGRFEVTLKQDVVPYAKGGVKPSVTVRFRTGDEKWVMLAEGQDYTLSYRNHTAVNDGSNQNKQPAVTVKGKGSFSGTYSTALTYKIVAQDIGQLTLTAQDKTYQNKKNVFATRITITDLDGKALKMGTDYNKVLIYSYANETTVNTVGNGMIVRAAGAFVDKNDIIPAGTILKVQAEAKSGGNYAGTLTGEYRITQAAISSASVSVPKQIYTGRAITLEKNQFTVKIKGKQLDESQYEIVPNSYKNNVKKGTATVKIRGLDNYGGTKDVKFTIKAKGFLWWWR